MPIHISLARASDDDLDLTEDAAASSDASLPQSAALSDRARRFVLEYVRDLDGTAAAARAGFPRNHAAHWSAAALRRPEVQDAIRNELAARTARLRLSTDRITEEVMRIAFADPGRIARWTPDGITLIHSDDLTDDDRAAVKRIHLGPPLGKGKHKRAQLFEMHDKLAALELLARITGLLSRGKPVSLGDARERKDANAILRERLLKIARSGEKEDGGTGG